MKTFFTPIFLICIIGNLIHADAQVQQAWLQQYLESQGNEPFSVDVKTDGTFVYVLGVLYRPNVPADALLVKYNSSSGVIVWEQTYNGPNNYEDIPTDMALDAAGNIYVVGTSAFYNPISTSETFTLKYRSDGTLLWSSRYLRPDNRRSNLTSVAVDASGNVYATGSTDSPLSSYDFLTIKYDPWGAQQWLRTYNGTNGGYDANTMVAVDAVGNIHVTGESDGKTIIQGFPLYTGQDFLTIKYDPNGNTIWSRRNGTFEDDIPKSMVVDGSSNVYITGEGDGPVGKNFRTVRYDANGALVWSATYDGPAGGEDYGKGIVVNTAGECYVTGHSEDKNGSASFKTIKYSAAGVQLWQRSYKGPANIGASADAIAMDGSGNIYVTGSCADLHNRLEIGTLKYTSSGTQSWAIVYSGTPDSFDLPYAIAVYTPPGPTILRPSVYVTGDFQTPGNDTGRYLITIKYVQNVIMGPLSSSAVSNYPNPFAFSTTIVYELTEESQVSLQIVDMLTGRQVESISIGTQSAGEQRYHYQPGNLPKGNYVYTIVAASANGRSIQRKVMRMGD